MAFERNTQFEKQLDFKNGSNDTYEFPRGNFYDGVTLDINFDVSISVAPAVTALQHQVARIIEEVIIMRDGENVSWQLSGETLARLFKKQKGVEAASNMTITGATGDNKKGRCFLHIPFNIIGGLKASDAAMDTVHHKYELKIKYRDIKADGTLFADTSAATIELNSASIDLELHKVTPIAGPNGAPDSYLVNAPLFPGLMERQDTVAQTKSDFDIEMPEYKTCYSVFMFAQKKVSAENWQGSNDILSSLLTVRNTQGRVIQQRKATVLREETSMVLEQGSNLENGFYILPLTQHGNVVDSIVSDGTKPLYVRAGVTKPAEDANIVTVTQTIEQQG